MIMKQMNHFIPFSRSKTFVITLLLSAFVFNSCTTTNTAVSRNLNNRAPAYDGIILDEHGHEASSEDEMENIENLIPSTSESSAHFSFDWPVDQARMTRGFLPNKRRPHLGIDLAAPRGTSIFAAHPGMVIYVGRDFRGFGKMVLIESGYGWASIYAHLDKFMVKEGQVLKTGDLVGQMGRTGRATGVHLHFEIRKDKGPVDPLLYLPGGSKVARQTTR